VTADPAHPRTADRASGALRAFNRAGVLHVADVHVADRLTALAGEPDPRVVLAVALAVRAVRHGSMCVDLQAVRTTVVVDAAPGEAGPVAARARAQPGAEPGVEPVIEPGAEPGVDELPWPDPDPWLAACAASPLVAAGDGAPRPLRLDGTRLYLDRHWQDERLVAEDLDRRMAAAPARRAGETAAAVLESAFPGAAAADQRAAAEAALHRPLTIVTGGPGTGKTRIVAGLVAAALAEPGPVPRVGLAAPTGRAAARLTESVRDRAGEAWAAPVAERLAGLRARTLHRMLGPLPGTRSRFRHDRHNRLPYDLVVVDETSMVSLPLMARLLEAVRADARLVLVGDPDQLSSVEAGAVLRDVVDLGERRGPDGPVRRLRHNFRTGAARLHTLASAVRDGDPGTALDVLASGDGVDLVDVDVAGRAVASTARLAGVRADVLATGRLVTGRAAAGDAAGALAGALAHRLLCGRRSGPYGARRWADEIGRWLADSGVQPRPPGWPAPRWPVGTPVVVTANDDDNGLANGDAGIVVTRPGGGVAVAFEGPGGTRLLHPDRVAHLAHAHTLTVHKAQGSEYDAVTVVLPPEGSPLLTRELLYTAVTRARSRVRVVATPEAVRSAVLTRVVRAGGLTAGS